MIYCHKIPSVTFDSELCFDIILRRDLKETRPPYQPEMARRGRLDIIADILRTANRGSKKTRLVYETNTNFVLMKEYLDLLERRGLVLEYDSTVYTTDAGNDYLLYYDELTGLLTSDVKRDTSDEKMLAEAREQRP